MSLLDLISRDTEKIIWNYFHLFNKNEENIKKIINSHFLDNIELDINNGLNINLLDFLEIYSILCSDFVYKKPIIIKFLNDTKGYHIDDKNVKNIIKKNKKKFNCLIEQLIKLYNSDAIYILIKKK